MHEWWSVDPAEHYWIEVTDREDVGADLNAPVAKDNGQPFWSYDLIMFVADGDVVFHFHKPSKGVVGYSYASGSWWDDQVIWGARGTSARDAGVQPYPRPGRRLGLHHFTPLPPNTITLATLRAQTAEVLAVRDDVEQMYRAPTYFPFGPYPREGLRPAQGYLFKFPARLLRVVGLDPIAALSPTTVAPAVEVTAPSLLDAATVTGGLPYRPAAETTAISYADPLPRDPALIERALAAHAVTQNELADIVRLAGLAPLSPAPDDPDWDLAFWHGTTFVVAEVKSLSRTNEERQLRMGLGQLLRYRHHLSARHSQVRAMLVTEREPADASWLDLCASVGVELCWRGTWPTL